VAGRLLLAFVQAVAGASGEEHEPEVQAYVECKLRALALALAGPAHDPAPELDDVAAHVAAAAQARRAARAPAIMVLATDDSEETVRSKTVAALERCGWNVSKAARFWGSTRQSVWRRMKRHVIARPEPSPFDREPQAPERRTRGGGSVGVADAIRRRDAASETSSVR